MTLGTAERLRILPETIQVTMDNILLEEDLQKSELLLGCQIEANLKWKKQIQSLLEKLRKRIVGLMKIKNIVPYNLRKTITEGLFNSVLVYCLPLFGGMGAGEMRELQIMQNKAARIVSSMPPRANRSSMFDKLGWLTVNQLTFYHTVILVFKLRSNKNQNILQISSEWIIGIKGSSFLTWILTLLRTVSY